MNQQQQIDNKYDLFINYEVKKEMEKKMKEKA